MRHQTKYIPMAVALFLVGMGCQTTSTTPSVSNSRGLDGNDRPPCPNLYDKSLWSDCYGTVTSVDGRIYVGQWKEGLPHGQGDFTFVNGAKYVGEIKGGLQHGQGTYTDQKGSIYIGEWKRGKQHGRGSLNEHNGSKYTGEWKSGKFDGQGVITFSDGRIYEGYFENGEFKYAQKVSPTVTNDRSISPRIRKKPKRQTRKTDASPSIISSSTGSGFFVSKLGHVVTNEHIVRNCGSITVGDNGKKQVATMIVETDKRKDLALLKISSIKLTSADTKTLIRKLDIKVVPLAAGGLLRLEGVELGERVLVAGYPYGEIFSDTVKVTGGIVSANRGLRGDTGQFQIDAAVQPGGSGGPIYDKNGNIVGVVVSQLNKLKVAKAMGSLPENVNFGIKASIVRQFLMASGLPTKLSNRSRHMSTKDLAKIAKNQTVMVVCTP
jgi:S1-C subfamily serine protease